MRLDSLYQTADKPTSSLMSSTEFSETDENRNKKLVKQWLDASNIIEREVSEIRKTLERDFRKLLGVE